MPQYEHHQIYIVKQQQEELTREHHNRFLDSTAIVAVWLNSGLGFGSLASSFNNFLCKKKTLRQSGCGLVKESIISIIACINEN